MQASEERLGLIIRECCAINKTMVPQCIVKLHRGCLALETGSQELFRYFTFYVIKKVLGKNFLAWTEAL